MGRKESYLLVDDSDNATKIAFIEDGRLAEFWRKEDGHELGEVHLARVLHTQIAQRRATGQGSSRRITERCRATRSGGR